MSVPDSSRSSPLEAIDALAPRLKSLGAERVALDDSNGRVLAEDVTADRDSPASDVSSMDGYAARFEDLALGRLPVSADVRMGDAPPALAPKTSVRIVTGGGIPVGADVILKREIVAESGEAITFDPNLATEIQPGTFIRRAGENLRAGDVVVRAGAMVTPPVVGALSTFGVAKPLVRARLRVSVLSTGDEVLDVHASPNPFQLRDANAPGLRAVLEACAWIDVVRVAHCADVLETMTRAVGAALADSDALILAGGVSMGQKDFVPEAIRRSGGTIVFHRVAQRPGKPILGAVGPEGQCILGLPGNPVSVMVTARRIGEALFSVMAQRRRRAPLMATVHQPDDKTLHLWWHRLVRLREDGAAELVDGRSSGDIASAARADGFIEMPPHEACGAERPFYSWEW